VKTQDALSLLIALEGRVARVYFHFFRTFRHDSEMARCWWDMAGVEAAEKVRDLTVRQRLETMLGGAKGR